MSKFIQVSVPVSWSGPNSLAFDLDPEMVFGSTSRKAPRIFFPRSQTRESGGEVYLSKWIVEQKMKELPGKLGADEFNLKAALWAMVGYGAISINENTPQEIKADALLALFDEASNRVKYPKVSFGEGDALVKFARAGRASKYNGSVNVTDGKPFGQNKWYGRIERDGNFKPSRSCTQAVSDQVKDFNADPAGYSAARGKATGNCVFCRQTLSDDRSLNVGYGKTCANTYALPWGSK